MVWPFTKIGFNTSTSGLAQQFVVAAAITIAVSMGMIAFSITRQIEASMMQTAAEEGALLTEALLGPSSQELATSRSLTPESVKNLDDLLLGKLGERVRLIKIWLPDATLVYSTNKQDIGQRFPSPHVAAAVQGKVTGEFEYLDDSDHATHANLSVPLIEIYAPLVRTGTRDIIAVGEVYNDGRRLAADLASIRLTSAGIVAGVSAPMMIILYFMVRRASDLVNSHQKSLVQKMNEAENLAVQNDKLRREADDARLESASAIESLLGRIGQDLHDGPIQLLSLLMLNLPDSSEGEAGAKSASDAPHHISLQGLSARILAELRDISTGLVLPELDELTATQTVLLAVHQHEEVTGTEVQCRIENLPEDLALSLKICLYRIVQEGLNNAFKYAQGIGQCVEASADERKISIAVSDKGPGFPENDTDKTRTRTGLGLAGLKNRVAALKGSFESRSQPGVGTALRARLPIARLGS